MVLSKPKLLTYDKPKTTNLTNILLKIITRKSNLAFVKIREHWGMNSVYELEMVELEDCTGALSDVVGNISYLDSNLVGSRPRHLFHRALQSEKSQVFADLESRQKHIFTSKLEQILKNGAVKSINNNFYNSFNNLSQNSLRQMNLFGNKGNGQRRSHGGSGGFSRVPTMNTNPGHSNSSHVIHSEFFGDAKSRRNPRVVKNAKFPEIQNSIDLDFSNCAVPTQQILKSSKFIRKLDSHRTIGRPRANISHSKRKTANIFKNSRIPPDIQMPLEDDIDNLSRISRVEQSMFLFTQNSSKEFKIQSKLRSNKFLHAKSKSRCSGNSTQALPPYLSSLNSNLNSHLPSLSHQHSADHQKPSKRNINKVSMQKYPQSVRMIPKFSQTHLRPEPSSNLPQLTNTSFGSLNTLSAIPCGKSLTLLEPSQRDIPELLNMTRQYAHTQLAKEHRFQKSSKQIRKRANTHVKRHKSTISSGYRSMKKSCLDQYERLQEMKHTPGHSMLSGSRSPQSSRKWPFQVSGVQRERRLYG